MQPRQKKGYAMKICLVQHGLSVSEEVDPARPLSDKGRKDVEKIAEFLKGVGLKVSIIQHSGKTRAAQTAEIINAKITPSNGILQKQGLAPNDPVRPIRDEILKAQEDLMIVGHLPFLNKLASRLLGGKEDQEFIAFQQGGIVCLEKANDDTWRIGWMIVPGLLKYRTQVFNASTIMSL